MANRVLVPSNLRRELGTIKINEYMSREWAKGLENSELFGGKKKVLPEEYTQVIYSGDLRATIFGVALKADTSKMAAM